MKTLRMSDEDYDALLYVLSEAVEDAKGMAYEYGSSDPDTDTDALEAQRVLDLLKPIEYEETDQIFGEMFPDLCEAMSMLKHANIPTTLQVTRELGKDIAVLEARQVRYWLPEGYQFTIGSHE
jgi:hypothetical protein